MEIWRKIPNISEEYEVSNLGRVRRIGGTYQTTFYGQSITRSKPPKIFALRALSAKGYQRINLEGRVRQIHRIVALAFLPNPDGLPQINHKDGIKTNNKVENLEWCTNQDNRNHAVANGLHAKGPRPHIRKHGDVVAIRAHTMRNEGVPIRRIARELGIHPSSMRKIIKRNFIPSNDPPMAAALPGQHA